MGFAVVHPMNVSSALAGFAQADKLFSASAAEVTKSATDPNADPVKGMVGMKMAETQERASVSVAKSVSDTLGKLIDTFA